MTTKKHAKGPWRLGRPGCVVCDAPVGLPGHDDPGAVAYYVGHLICESVVSPADAQLIAAAPAYALAWSLVPDNIKGRIFDALHKPDSGWVADAITRAEGREP